MRYSKELEWLNQYVEMAKTFIPNLSKLDAVYRIPLAKDKRQAVHGTCLQAATGRYKIMLYLEYNLIVCYHPKKFKRRRYSKIDTLVALAHELAHMTYWDHCPKRQLLECQMTMVFMANLQREGYVSEEFELKKGNK